MRGTLAGRLLFWVGLPATILFGVFVWLSSEHSRDRVMRETEESSRHLARYHAQRIENRLGRAAVVAGMIANEMETQPKATTDELYAYLRNVVARNRFIYGSCIAFEPYSFDPARKFLAPYFYWKGNSLEFVQLGNPEYDYFKWEWYDAPKKENRARWSEPYFDEGGGEAVMTTFSVPFHRDGAFWGIATIDITMSELTAEVEAIRKAGHGYAFIVSEAGKFLAHPDRALIMKGSLFSANEWLGRRMTNGEDGFVRARDPWKQQDAWIAFVPIATGKLSLGIVHPARELNAKAAAVQADLLTLGIIGLIALLAMLLLIVRSFSRPIAALAQAAQQIAAGDLDVEIRPHTRTREVAHLTDAFRKMTADLKTRIDQLRHATDARERMEGELSAARTIQASILPAEFPPFPDRQEFEVHALVRPAREVGGDFFNFYLIDREWLCLVLGDVAGKGVPAALVMAVTTTMIKSHSSDTRSPSRILSRTNRELCRQNEAGMFVTVFCALLNIRSGSLVYCNAGHNPPFILSPHGALARLDARGGPALGALEDIGYEDSETLLKPGDALFAFTDGVTEATNAGREFYGERRLTEILSGNASATPEELATRVSEDVNGFAQSAAQADDITVLVLRFFGISGKNQKRAGETTLATE
jgi:sigma-B regulation protein RsbU (phosphoserine phosphatase)